MLDNFHLRINCRLNVINKLYYAHSYTCTCIIFFINEKIYIYRRGLKLLGSKTKRCSSQVVHLRNALHYTTYNYIVVYLLVVSVMATIL